LLLHHVPSHVLSTSAAGAARNILAVGATPLVAAKAQEEILQATTASRTTAASTVIISSLIVASSVIAIIAIPSIVVPTTTAAAEAAAAPQHRTHEEERQHTLSRRPLGGCRRKEAMNGVTYVVDEIKLHQSAARHDVAAGSSSIRILVSRIQSSSCCTHRSCCCIGGKCCAFVKQECRKNKTQWYD